MKITFILATVLLPLTVGCQLHRTVELEVSRIVVEVQQSSGITADAALTLFREVAINELGLTVDGPIHAATDRVEYVAPASLRKVGDKLMLVMWIEPTRVRFESSTYGTKSDFLAAESAAAKFENALRNRGIQYQRRTWRKPPLWKP